MNTTRRSSKLLAVAAASALIIAACGSDDDTSAPDSSDAAETGEETEATDAPDSTDAAEEGEEEAPAEGASGGTLVWAHEQEPPDLHLDNPENNLSIASWIIQPMWEGLHGITGDTTFFPELLAEDGEVVENEDGTVTVNYVLRDGLTWSDGDDLTADDVKFTHDVIMAQDDAGEFIYLIGDRTGYDTVTEVAVASPTEFSISWSAPYSGYKAMYPRVFPSHVFSADDPAAAAAEMNAALPEWTHEGTTLPSSGPLVFESWNKGQNMNFVRNETYHGSVSPDVQNPGAAFVDGVTLNFVTDTDAQINALQAGEAQMIFTQPQLQFESLTTDDQFAIESLAGPVYEHWGFNLNNVHLSKPEVREAVALAMDKGEVMAGLYTPLFGDTLPAEGLGNTYWMSNQPAYVDHQTEAGYGAGDADAARAALESVGYVEGADGIYEHPEDGKLTLRVGTTGGNALRELQQQLLQAGLGNAGIEIVIDNVEGGAYFSERPFAADSILCSNSGGAEGNCDLWDITQFAWVGGPWPGGNSAAFRTESGNNPYGYSNADFDAKATECEETLEEEALAECFNELDKFVTTLEVDPNGLVVVALTQKPSFYAYNSQVLSQAAVSPDANDAGPLVNVVDYQFAS